MNNRLLIELADGWEIGADMDRSATAERRETLRECADTLRSLVQLDDLEIAKKPVQSFGSGSCQAPP